MAVATLSLQTAIGITLRVACLFGEHLRQYAQKGIKCRCIDFPHTLDQSRRVDGPHLVRQYQSRLAFKSHIDSKSGWTTTGSHGCDDGRAHMIVHLVW